jgi:hypothetical protein
LYARPEGIDIVAVVNNVDESMRDGRAGAVVVATSLTDGVELEVVLFYY